MKPSHITLAAQRAYCASPVTVYRPDKRGRLVKVKTIVVGVVDTEPHSHGLHQGRHRRGRAAKAAKSC